jgi:hypothetical protein
MNKTKIILGAVVALIIGIVIGAMFAPSNSNLGSVRFTADKFVGGLTAGTSDQLSVDVSGNIVTTGRTTVTNTVQSGKASVAGCLILGDSAAGASPVYITATGATITASTTKPTACSTAL